MKALRTCLLMALSAMLAFAFAVPAIASAANWTEDGKEMTAPELEWIENGAPLGETEVISVDGPMTFTGSLGGVDCNVSGEAALIPEKAGLIYFEAAPATCKLTGGLKSICTEVTSVTSESMPWSAAPAEVAKSQVVKVSDLKMAYAFKGGWLCPKVPITISGTITATPDDSAEISSLALSGEAESTLGGNVTLGGSLAVDPPETYGIALEERNVELSGTMGWIGGIGGISCSASGDLELETGGEGQVTAFDWSSCKLTGGIASTCSSASIVPTGLPWAATAEGEGASRQIEISTIAFEVHFTGGFQCPSKWVFSGDMKAVPDDPDSISSTQLSGTLTGSFSAAWSASLAWDPAEVYGIQ